MIAAYNGSNRGPTFRVGTYNNGQPYIPARGSYAPRERVEDYLAASHAVINLPHQKPTAADFVRIEDGGEHRHPLLGESIGWAAEGHLGRGIGDHKL